MKKVSFFLAGVGMVLAGWGATVEVGSVAELKSVVAGAVDGDAIRLAEGEYVLDATLEVNAAVTMESAPGGGMAVISGNGAVRILETTKRLTLRNLRLERGYFKGGWGAGVLVKIGGSLDVERCQFVSNVQVSANWAHCGGAIAFRKHDEVLGGLGYDDPASSIRDSLFFANSGDNCGGAILGYSTAHNRPWGQGLEVRNCVFRDNRGKSGAGIGVFRGSENLTVWNSVFHSHLNDNNNPELPPDGNPNLAGGSWDGYPVRAGAAFGCLDSNGDVQAKFFNCLFIPYYTWAKSQGAFGYARSPRSFDLEVSHCVLYRHSGNGADDTAIGGAGKFQMYGDGNVVTSTDSIWAAGGKTFVDASSMDYRPNPINESLLIDAGVAGEWMAGAGDYAGAARIDRDGVCDIGPVEYHAPVVEVGAGREVKTMKEGFERLQLKSAMKVDDGEYEIEEGLVSSLDGLTIEGNNADPGAVTIRGKEGAGVVQLVRLNGADGHFSGFTLTGAEGMATLVVGESKASCGAIAVYGSTCISNCIMTGNAGMQDAAAGHGNMYFPQGGVGAYLDNPGAKITDCKLYGNVASNVCGIVRVRHGRMERCEVRDNLLYSASPDKWYGLGAVVLGKGMNKPEGEEWDRMMDEETRVWDAQMKDCEVHHNKAYHGGYAGSGVWALGIVRVEGTKIWRNEVWRDPASQWSGQNSTAGFGMTPLFKYLEVERCVVSNCLNASVNAGYGTTGMLAPDSPGHTGIVRVRDTVFADGDSRWYDAQNGGDDSGAIQIGAGVDFLMDRCRVTGYRKAGKGLIALNGGWDESGRKVVRNTLIAENVVYGGWSLGCPLIRMEGEFARLENCTIASNRCPESTAKVFEFAATVQTNHNTTVDNKPSVVVNCVIYGNSNREAADAIKVPEAHPEWKDNFTNCCTSAGSAGLLKTEGEGGGWWGAGNFAAALRFRDPGAGDWGIRGTGSPLVNRGVELGWMREDGALDLAGLPRVSGERPDIGCYEYQIRKGMAIVIR